MTPSRFRQIERLYHAVREQQPDGRARFLDEACAGDDDLRRQVESLLAEDVSNANLLDEFAGTPADASAVDDSSVPVFSVGSQIGSYRIEGPIGQGGMGVVYKAVDTRLNRPVAVKVLSHRLADVAARRRFQREAQMASSLNHPHILTVYDAGEHDGEQYLVTEYIDGGTLREWSEAAPRTPREIVELLTGVADGLAAAHEAKILHRDIKPANILVMKSGYAKLADFGLAKLQAASPGLPGATRTMTAQTQPGMVVGTIAYMCPEQVQGKMADARSDIFSFGVLLYELLAGRRPFDGRSELETLHRIIEASPEPLGDHVPAALRGLVAKALQKDPELRYQSVREMVSDLRALTRGSDAPALSVPARPAPPTPPRKRRRGLFYSAAAAAVLLAAGASWYFGRDRGPVAIPSEFVQLTNFNDYATAPAISPDGSMVAFFRGGSYFLTTGQIYLRLIASGESRQLTDDQSRKYAPVFSPDGSRVAYTVLSPDAGFDTWTVPVLGGAPSRMMNNAAGLIWSAPDRILFSEIVPGSLVHMGIVAARESRAEERRIYLPAHERGMAHYSYPSPDRSRILIVEMDKSQEWLPCRLVPMDGSSPGTPVGPPGRCIAAGWSPDGKWMYLNVGLNGGTHLWRQRYPDGAPQQITFAPTEEEGLAVAPDGKSLITALGLRQSSIWIHDGARDYRLPVDGAPSQPRFSSDARRIYYLVNNGDSSGRAELWARDLVSGKTDPILSAQPIADYDVSPDQKSVAFTVKAGLEKSIFTAPVDRGSSPRLVTRNGDEVSFSGSSDLVFRSLGERSNYLARVHIDGTGLARISEYPIAEKQGASPDGAWAAVGAWAGPGKGEGTFLISLRDGSYQRVCTGPCVLQWSVDSKYLFITLDHTPGDQKTTGGSAGRTLVIPLPRGLAEAPRDGFSVSSGDETPGIPVIRQWLVAPGFDANSYAYTTTEFQGNLYRIPLHGR